MHRIEIEDSSGIRESVENYTKLVYEGELNGVRIFDLLVEGRTPGQATKFATNNKIYIYRLGSLQLKGIIKKRSFTANGMLRLQGIGYVEQKLKDANAPNYTWSSTTTSGVVSTGSTNILSKTPSITAGTIENQTVNSFRTYSGKSCLYAITKLCRLTGQDFSFDDANDKLVIEDHHGSSTSTATLSDGIEIDQVTKEEDEFEKVKKVTVIGKSEGSQQITGSYSSGWSQGDPEITIIDKSIDTTTEANDRALQEYNIRSQTRYTYKMRVIDQSFTFTVGDVITINAPSAEINNTDVRIVKYKRVVIPKAERLYIEVRGTTEREAAESRLKQLLENKSYADDANALKQGTDTAPSITSVTGSVSSAPSVTSVTGSVTAHGSSDTGYFFGGYSDNLTGDNTWRNVGTSVNIGGYTYLFHGINGYIRIDFNNTGSGHSFSQVISIRAKNTTDSTYYPNSSGIVLCGGFSLDSGLYIVIIPFYLHIPKNWTNKNYILQYKIQNETDWGTGYFQEIGYNYHGSRGHIHGDTFDTTDSNHSHSDTFDTTDSDHSH